MASPPPSIDLPMPSGPVCAAPLEAWERYGVQGPTYSGRFLRPEAVRRGLGFSLLAAAFCAGWSGLSQGWVLTLFFDALGANGFWIGAVNAVVPLSMLMMLPAAWHNERGGSRRRYWFRMALAHRALWFLPAVALWFLPAPGRWAPAMVTAVTAVSYALGNAGCASWHSWHADLVPEGLRGRFWGWRQIVTTAVALLATGFAGGLLDRRPAPPDGDWSGFLILLWAGAAMGILDILLQWPIPEPRPTPPASGAGRRMFASLRDPDFRRLTLALGSWTFTVGLLCLGVLYLKDAFGATNAHVSMLVVCGAVGGIAACLAGGRLIDHFGARKVGTAALALYPLSLAIWFVLPDGSLDWTASFGETAWGRGGAAVLAAFGMGGGVPRAVWASIPVSVVSGGAAALMAVCQLNQLGRHAPKSGRTLAMAVHWAATGFVGAAGPLVAGALKEWLPAAAGGAFSHQHVSAATAALVIWAVTLPLWRRVGREGGAAS